MAEPQIPHRTRPRSLSGLHSRQTQGTKHARLRRWRRLFAALHPRFWLENNRPAQDIPQIHRPPNRPLSNLPQRLLNRGEGALGRHRSLDLRPHHPSAPLSLRASQVRHAHQVVTAPATDPPRTPALGIRHLQTTAPPSEHSRSKVHLSRTLSSTLILIGALFLVGGGLIYQTLSSTLNTVFAEALTGQDHLALAESALRNADFKTAQSEFLSAQNSFEQAINEMGGKYSLSAIPGINIRIEAGTKLMETGRLIATSGYQLTTSLEPMADILRGQGSTQITQETSLTDYSADLITTLSLGRPQLKLAKEQLEVAAALLNEIKPSTLGSQYAGQLEASQDKVAKLVKMLEQVYELSEILPGLLGDSTPQNYLFLFQNNAELRPTGGFIGSFGVATFADGKLDKFFTDNVYNPDGQIELKGLCEKPPAALYKHFKDDCWGLRDANWFPDFPSSARQAAKFYEQVADETINGVIAITPDVLRELLILTGPIYLYDWNEVVNADNVIALVQYKVSVEFREFDNPKLFLMDLASVLMERLQTMTPDQWPALLKIAETGFSRKSIQIYPFDAEAARFVHAHQIDGTLPEAQGDYLYVNNANLGGTKSSQFMSEEYRLKTIIQADGSIDNELTITYKHTGTWDWPGGHVKNYQRIYVPKGSRLLQSSGTEPEIGKLSLTDTFDEYDKTVFADSIRITPNATVTVSYTYRLPFRLDPATTLEYHLQVVRQPGTADIPFYQDLIYDNFRLDPLLASPTFEFKQAGLLQNTLLINQDSESVVQFTPHRVI